MRQLDDFPGSSHVAQCGLLNADDNQIRKFASDRGFAIVTKDRDFVDMAVLSEGPKVVWLRVGNCSVQDLVALLAEFSGTILEFGQNPRSVVLVVPPGLQG